MQQPSHSFDLNTQQYLVNGTERKAPRYTVFCTPIFFVHPRTKYSPQNPILKHPKSNSFPHYYRPSFAPIQSKRKKLEFCFL